MTKKCEHEFTFSLSYSVEKYKYSIERICSNCELEQSIEMNDKEAWEFLKGFIL